MSENLNKKPPKGILKTSSSFDKPGTSNHALPSAAAANSLSCSDAMSGSIHRKSAKFDEMNIIETLHPPDKDYGHMKIEEPKTPFNYYEDGEDMEKQGVDPTVLQKMLETQAGDDSVKPCDVKQSLSEEDEDQEEEEEEEALDPEERARRQVFETKRKAHYNEYYAVKLARKLLEQEEDEEDNNDGEGSNGSGATQGFIPNEELDE